MELEVDVLLLLLMVSVEHVRGFGEEIREVKCRLSSVLRIASGTNCTCTCLDFQLFDTIRTALSSVIDDLPSRQCPVFALPRVLGLHRAVIYQFECLRHIPYVTKYMVCRLLWRAHAGSFSSRDGHLNRYIWGPVEHLIGRLYRSLSPVGLISLGVITAFFNVHGQTRLPPFVFPSAQRVAPRSPYATYKDGKVRRCETKASQKFNPRAMKGRNSQGLTNCRLVELHVTAASRIPKKEVTSKLGQMDRSLVHH